MPIIGALTALATANALAFNGAVPDDATVYYQSWAGVATLRGSVDETIRRACDGGLLKFTKTAKVESNYWKFLPTLAGLSNSKPNDGLILVSSAVHGTFQGCMKFILRVLRFAPLAGPDKVEGETQARLGAARDHRPSKTARVDARDFPSRSRRS